MNVSPFVVSFSLFDSFSIYVLSVSDKSPMSVHRAFHIDKNRFLRYIVSEVNTVRVIIDRFEEEFAVAELPDKSMLSVPKALFDGAEEGDAVEITVLGKPYEQEEGAVENPAGIFETLRRKSKKKKKKSESDAE